MTNRKDVFSPDEMIYFSPDAPDPISTIDPSKVYVIGGLVDRSIAKVSKEGWKCDDRINRTIERRSWAFLLCGCLWRSFIPIVSIEVSVEREMNRSDEYQHHRGDDYRF